MKTVAEDTINLNFRNQSVRVRVRDSAAIVVGAVPAIGSWASGALKVRRVVGGVGSDFSPARSIAAGGGSVTLSTADLEGCSSVEILGPDSSIGSDVYVRVSVEQESE